MISEVLRKREMQCVFQDEWFQPDTGRKEKVIWRRKKQLDQRGLPVYFQMVPVLDV